MRRWQAAAVGSVVAELGEGPQPHGDAAVSWVDIASGVVWRSRWTADGPVDPASTSFPSTVGAALPAVGGGMLVMAHDRLAVIGGGGQVRTGPALTEVGPGMRFNDAGADPRGRVFVGTLCLSGDPGRASLFRVEDDGGITPVRSGLTLSNGLGWSPDGAVMYHVDSVPGTVWAADYDLDTSTPRGWRVLAEDLPATPDGMCVDAEGFLWVALWAGSSVVRLDPGTGGIVAAVDVPVRHVTSAAFVGPGRGTLLITTARNELSHDERAAAPAAGRLFVADVGVTGIPEQRWTGSTGEPPWG